MTIGVDLVTALRRHLDSPDAVSEIAAAFARRFSQAADAQAVTWDGEAGRQMDEIDRIITGS
ncbi:MAG TPA: hypothetical protein VID47_06715 [Actinomycetota bacterium]|jgi:hypothetical protein